MSISHRIADAWDLFANQRFESSLILACVAIDATARQLYPDTKLVGDRFNLFIDDNLPLITQIGIGSRVSGTVFMPGAFDDLVNVHRSKEGYVNFRDIVYKGIRCCLVHEAELHGSIEITNQPILKAEENGNVILPSSVVLGLMLSVVGARTNRGGSIGPQYSVVVKSKSLKIDEYWGERSKLLAVFERACGKAGILVNMSGLWDMVDHQKSLICPSCNNTRSFPYTLRHSIEPKGCTFVGVIGEDTVHIKDGHSIWNCPPSARFKEIFINCSCGHTLFAYKDD